MTLGGAVSKTISKKIIDPEAFVEDSNLYAVAMTSVLAGAAFSVCSVTVYGIPVSITKAVIFGKNSNPHIIRNPNPKFHPKPQISNLNPNFQPPPLFFKNFLLF